MKKILMLGAGDAQIDAIEYCKNAGHIVGGCSYTTKDHGIKLLDFFENVDIKDREAVKDIAIKHDVDYVYSIGSDIAMPTVMDVSKTLGLAHFVEPKCAEICLRKDRIREKLGSDCDYNLPFRIYKSIEEAIEHQKFPAMMKPVDSQGQRGCFRVDCTDDIIKNFEGSMSFSSVGLVIVEEYVDGEEISVNAYMVDGDLIHCIISDRLSNEDYPGGIIEKHRIPSQVAGNDQNIVESIVNNIAKKLGVSDGPFYLQIKKTESGDYKLLEAMPRMDGCHLWRLIKTRYGINLLEIMFEHLIGGGETRA